MNRLQLKQSIHRWISIGLMVSLLPLFGCEDQSPHTQLEAMINRGKLRVGTVFGASSYYIDRDGSAGFEYELAQAFADYLKLELEIVPNYHVSQLFPMLDSDQVDLLAGGLTVTEQRAKKYRFSPGYYNVSQKLVFKQGNQRPKNFEELEGTLVVTSQSSHAESLMQQKLQMPQLTWQETSEQDPDELLEQVANGEISYTISDSNNLAINRRFYPNLSIGFTVHPEQSVAWIITQQNDDSLYALLIEFFGQIKKSGQLTALTDKYFGHVEAFNYSDTRMFIEATQSKLPKYQALFQQYAMDLDWRLLAALSYQESLWQPNAKSHTGVRGIMMLTLPTAKQMGIKSRLDPEQSIKGGAKYLNRMVQRIPERIQMPDRLWFAIAAYNIGWGHVEDARVITQNGSGDPDKWIDVKARLPLLKQKKYYKKSKYGYARGDEPVKYVDKIRRYYHSLVWLDEKSQAQEKANDYLEKLTDSLQNLPDATLEHITDQQITEDQTPETLVIDQSVDDPVPTNPAEKIP